jgi:hypothetical protein
MRKIFLIDPSFRRANSCHHLDRCGAVDFTVEEFFVIRAQADTRRLTVAQHLKDVAICFVARRKGVIIDFPQSKKPKTKERKQMRLTKNQRHEAKAELLQIVQQFPGIRTSKLFGTDRFHGQRTLTVKQILPILHELKSEGRIRSTQRGAGSRTWYEWSANHALPTLQ